MHENETEPPSSGKRDFRVAVVGGGPVGLTAAALLAARDVPVVLVERNARTSDDAKAISMDAESVRTLHQCGLGEQVRRTVLPGTGVRFHDRRGRPLFQARGAGPYVFGHAVKSQFSQPELEAMLFDWLKNRPGVDVRMSTECVSYKQDGAGVTVRLRTAGGEEDLRTDYLIGCDGGRSGIRAQSGIQMQGRSFDDVWLVADTVGDQHDDRCSMHFGNPVRPYVIVPGKEGRCRYEFLLRPGEGEASEKPDFELVRRLLSPFRDITPDQLERAVNYRFHGLVAERWRSGRVFLAGDAAHMMPPFAGQGLNSGIRDVANLCWKLALVGNGNARPALLESYEQERRPHAEATVHASVRQGEIFMTTDQRRAHTRDVAVRAMLRIPRTRDYLERLQYLPRARFTQGWLAPHGDPLVGCAFEQPRIQYPDGVESRLDSALGEDFALLGIDVTEDDWTTVRRTLPVLPLREVDVVLGDRRPRAGGPRTAVGDADGDLERLLEGRSGSFVLLRPDRYVAAVFSAWQSTATARALSAHLSRTERNTA